MSKLKEFIDEGIESFVHDPADSEFQEGYLSALKVAKHLYDDNYDDDDFVDFVERMIETYDEIPAITDRSLGFKGAFEAMKEEIDRHH